MKHFEYDPELGRQKRSGDINDQLIPTYDKIIECINKGDRENAVAFIEFCDTENAVSYNMYLQWGNDAKRFLTDRGMEARDLEGICTDLAYLANHFYNPDEPYDRDEELRKYHHHKALLIRSLNAPKEYAIAQVEEFRRIWQTIHDRDVDFLSGLFNAIVQRHGEGALETMYRDYVIGDLFDDRYERFDVSNRDWKDNFDLLVYLSIESMRGHLTGPRRRGDMEVVDHGDRLEILFDPCGSGGRTSRGDHLAKTPSRHEAPFYYQPLEQEHDWAINKKGVCHYCAHCTILLEKIPMEKYGYPIRTVSPPLYPDNNDKCSWSVYRDPRFVPEEIYARNGETKPSANQKLGSKRSI